MNDEKRENITLISLWYSVQIFRSVFMLPFGVWTESAASLPSQKALSLPNCASTAAPSPYFARISLPASRPPSPSRKISRALWPGCKVMRFMRLPQWLPPFSKLPAHCPASTATGLRSLRYPPRNVSRRQSKPSGAKSAVKNW